MAITLDGVSFTGISLDTNSYFTEQWGSQSGGTLSDSNRIVTQNSAIIELRAISVAPVPNAGKWYCELTMSDTGTFLMAAGLAESTTGPYCAARSNGTTAFVRSGVTMATQASFSAGTIQLAIDLGNARMWVGRNNTWFSSGNPSTGTNPYYSTIPAGIYYIFVHADNDGNGVGSAAIRTSYSRLTYTPPTGFLPLSL